MSCNRDKSISEITTNDIHNLLNNLEHPTVSKKYLTLNAVKAVFRYARNSHLLLTDPAESIHLPYPVSKGRTRFSQTELVSLKQSFLHTLLPDLFLFALVSGLSLKECAALKPSNINLASGEVAIHSRISFTRGADCTSRLEPVPFPRIICPPEPALALIRNLINNSDDCIFQSQDGRILHPHLMSSSHQIIRYHSGLHHFVNHHMEQNFVIRCLEKGVDSTSLEEYYGLRPGRILMAYTTYNAEGDFMPLL